MSSTLSSEKVGLGTHDLTQCCSKRCQVLPQQRVGSTPQVLQIHGIMPWEREVTCPRSPVAKLGLLYVPSSLHLTPRRSG